MTRGEIGSKPIPAPHFQIPLAQLLMLPDPFTTEDGDVILWVDRYPFSARLSTCPIPFLHALSVDVAGVVLVSE